MTLLLDTHYLLWVTMFPERLSKADRRAIASDQVFASAVSIWELRIKWHKLDRHGRRKGPADPAEILTALDHVGIETLPLLAEHAAATLGGSIEGTDPFDEQLLVHAQELGARLLTRDEKLLNHPLAYRFA